MIIGARPDLDGGFAAEPGKERGVAASGLPGQRVPFLLAVSQECRYSRIPLWAGGSNGRPVRARFAGRGLGPGHASETREQSFSDPFFKVEERRYGCHNSPLRPKRPS